MRKTIFVAIACLFLSMVPITLADMTLNILYGIIGVLFSVGMSLIISFNTSDVKNFELKNKLRESMHSVRNNFLSVFLLCSVYYVSFSFLGDSCKSFEISCTSSLKIHVNIAFSVFSYLLYSIIALVFNYVQIQKFYEDLEDRIQEEKKCC